MKGGRRTKLYKDKGLVKAPMAISFMILTFKAPNDWEYLDFSMGFLMSSIPMINIWLAPKPALIIFFLSDVKSAFKDEVPV